MIPKVIHFCWLSNDPYPTKIQKCIDSWKKNLPDYEFMLWNFERFPKGTSEWVDQAFQHKKYAFAADYIRLFALYNYGGIYLDSDVEVLKPFDDLLDLPYFIGQENTPFGIEAATMGCEKGFRLIEDLLKRYNNRNFVNADGSLNEEPMPAIMRKCIESNYKLNFINQKKEFVTDADTINVFPVDFFSPKTWDTKEISLTKRTYSIHHFAASWTDSKSKKNILQILRKLVNAVKGNLYIIKNPVSIVTNAPNFCFSFYRFHYRNIESPFCGRIFEEDFLYLIDHPDLLNTMESITFIKRTDSKYSSEIDDFYPIAKIDNTNLEIHFQEDIASSRKDSLYLWDNGKKFFSMRKVVFVYVSIDPRPHLIDALKRSSFPIVLITNKKVDFANSVILQDLTALHMPISYWRNKSKILPIRKKLKEVQIIR